MWMIGCLPEEMCSVRSKMCGQGLEPGGLGDNGM